MSSLDAGGGFLPLQQEPQRRKIQGTVVQVGAHVNSVSGCLKIEPCQYPWRCVHPSVGSWLWLQDCGREPAADTLLIGFATFNLRQ